MNGEISLTVTVEVQRSQHDPTCHRLFENSRRYWIAIAHNDSRKTNIDGDQLHVSFQILLSTSGLNSTLPSQLIYIGFNVRKRVTTLNSSKDERRFFRCMLAGRCENGSKACLAAYHMFIGLGCALQRKDFSHRAHTGEHAEGERIL